MLLKQGYLLYFFFSVSYCVCTFNFCGVFVNVHFCLVKASTGVNGKMFVCIASVCVMYASVLYVMNMCSSYTIRSHCILADWVQNLLIIISSCIVLYYKLIWYLLCWSYWALCKSVEQRSDDIEQFYAISALLFQYCLLLSKVVFADCASLFIF